VETYQKSSGLNLKVQAHLQSALYLLVCDEWSGVGLGHLKSINQIMLLQP
jgi:hypothetical protein